MANIRRVLRSPFVVLLPVLALLSLGWHQYIYADTHSVVPVNNILPNSDLKSVDTQSGLPQGWQATLSSGAHASTQQGGGGDSEHSAALTATSTSPGSRTTLLGPKTTVQMGERYFYKSFYNSTMPFDVILRTYRDDGSYDQMIVGHQDASQSWVTFGYVFTPRTTAAIQFIYSVTDKGTLKIGTTYLEPHPSDVYSEPSSSDLPNIIPNTSLTSTDQKAPEGWSGFSSGDNQASFSYLHDESVPYVRTSVSKYKNGEAKWQYTPVAVTPGQALDFTTTYRSDVTTTMVAEYVLSSGKRQFVMLAPAQPVQEWTTYTATIDVPPNAVNILVSAVLHQNGTLDTKEYSLTPRTQQGSLAWSRPLLSYSFDDGWESAYVNAVPQLDKAGYAATFYLNPAAIDTANFMTSNEVANLNATGYELASHSYEHINVAALDPSSIDYQLRRSYQYIHLAYDVQAVDFAPPFGYHDGQVDYYVRRYYASQRGTEDGINTKQSFDRYNLRVLYMGADMPLSTVTTALAEVEAAHGWLILVYHGVDDDSKKGGDTVTLDRFRQQLTAVESSNIHVATVAAALQEIQQQE